MDLPEIAELAKTIHKLELSLQAERTLHMQARKLANDRYEKILELEKKIAKLKGDLSWAGETICY